MSAIPTLLPYAVGFFYYYLYVRVGGQVNSECVKFNTCVDRLKKISSVLDLLGPLFMSGHLAYDIITEQTYIASYVEPTSELRQGKA